MELFPDGAHVRLRSRVRGTYLHADEDGVGVSLSPRRASLNAAWRVHRTLHQGSTCVLLHGAAYGRYLEATDERGPNGHRGQRVVQGVYDHPDATAIAWKVVGAGDVGDDDVLLRHASYRLLRANGRYLTWNNGVTVDHPDNRSTMMHWVVEALQPRPSSPILQPPPTGAIPSLPATSYQQQQQQQHHQVHPARRLIRLLRRRNEPTQQEQRTIRFVRADANGNFNEQGWATFQFQGRSVFNLRTRVAYHAREMISFHNITVCARAGRFGRLTPLTTDLPRSEEQMYIVAVTARSPATQDFQYPDVDAP